jgi:hypothetical protein
MISEQRVRARGGRASARGATVRCQQSIRTDRLIDSFDKRKSQCRLPNRNEINDMLVQAREACANFPDSISAQRRLRQLQAYKAHRSF